MMGKDTIRIKDWANNTFKEYINTINFYINNGIDKTTAVKMVLEGSTLGARYKAQLRKEFGLSIFD